MTRPAGTPGSRGRQQRFVPIIVASEAGRVKDNFPRTGLAAPSRLADLLAANPEAGIETGTTAAGRERSTGDQGIRRAPAWSISAWAAVAIGRAMTQCQDARVRKNSNTAALLPAA